MMKDCMRNEHGFGIALIKNCKEAGRAVEVYKTGTECYFADWEKLPDGLLGITAHGETKIYIENTHIEANHLMVGQVNYLEAEPDLELPKEFEGMRVLLQKVIIQVGEPYTTLPAGYDYAGWVGARLTELLPLQLATKQKLLEIDDHIVRLYHLKEAMQESNFL